MAEGSPKAPPKPVPLIDADGNLQFDVIIDTAHDCIYKRTQGNPKYKLVKRIGAGSFGDVFRAVVVDTRPENRPDKVVAVKIEPMSDNMPQLDTEYKIYKMFTPAESFPKIFVYMELKELGYYVMVMQYLGYSLEDLFVFCDRRFGALSALSLGDQMLSRLEMLHSKGWIHRDIKPDNFVMGNGRESNIAYLIDFGLAKKFYVDNKKKHIPFRTNKGLTGTARYASVNAHRGYEQSRRDDLEGMAHVLVYFIKGQLPWQGIRGNTKREKYEKIADKKISTTVESLCEGCPDEVLECLKIIKAIPFAEKPDYAQVHKLLRQGSSGWDEYDWIPRMRVYAKQFKNNKSQARSKQ